jgi:tetratricopeptide (TPR) repeat protein
MRLERLLHWKLTVSLLLVGAVTTAFAGSRVLGTAQDPNGKPVTGLTVLFTRLGEDGRTFKTQVKKKGRFSVASLPPGQYKIELVDSSMYISSAAFKVRRGDGLMVGGGEIGGHPRDGVTGLPVSGVDEIKLTLTVEESGALVTGGAEMTLSSPELAKAVQLFNQGKYEESIGGADGVLATEPDSGEAIYLKGLALESLGRLAEAEAALIRATGLIPDFPKIWGARAAISLEIADDHEANGRSDEATQAFGRAAEALTEAVERHPDMMSLRVNLAVSLDRIGDTEKLIPVLEGILEKDPAHLQSRLRLAAVYSASGDTGRAMELLDELPATEKRVAVTLFNVAVDLNDRGDLDGALVAARRAVEIDPELPEPYRLMAQIQLGKGEREQAKESIRRYLELAPDDAEAETYRRILQQLEQ